MSQGKFYVIATPIGNLNDITLRAVDVIKSADILLSEDTRETSKLLQHLGIDKKQISYRDQNHDRVFGTIEQYIKDGLTVALISDSGTPLISDPGFKLIRELIEKGIEINSIPGPSAVINSLVVSGLPTDKFTYLGFLPKSSAQREKLLIEYGYSEATLIIYESPYRLIKLLEEVRSSLGQRKVAVCREMTKIHEDIKRGYVDEIIDYFMSKPPKGEITVLIAKKDYE